MSAGSVSHTRALIAKHTYLTVLAAVRLGNYGYPCGCEHRRIPGIIGSDVEQIVDVMHISEACASSEHIRFRSDSATQKVNN